MKDTQKIEYISPVVEIIRFSTEDVITTSTITNGGVIELPEDNFDKYDQME